MNKGQFTWHKSTTQMGVFKSKISKQGNNLQTFRQTLKSLVITATWLAVSSAFINKWHYCLLYITSVLNCIISSVYKMRWKGLFYQSTHQLLDQQNLCSGWISAISKWQLQFWSEIILEIWNQTHTAHFQTKITLHSIQLP